MVRITGQYQDHKRTDRAKPDTRQQYFGIAPGGGLVMPSGSYGSGTGLTPSNGALDPREATFDRNVWVFGEPDYTNASLFVNAELPLALMGDWNIAPTAVDMADPSFVEGRSTHVSPDERSLFASFAPTVADVVRPIVPEGFTFWDYKAGKFQKNQGMRIDFILGSQAFADAVTGAEIARDERKGDGPSDHVPVVCDIDPSLLFASFEDEDDRPMIFG